MIVDCYTHTWESADQLGGGGWSEGQQSGFPPVSSGPQPAGIARHLAASEPVDATIVLGFKSHYLGAEIANEQIAAYVGAHPGRLIGFAGVDPSDPREAIAELHRALEELSMPGLNVAPAAQDFHPSSSQAMLVYAEAATLKMPILFHTGVRITAATKLEYANPVLLDEIARELPDLKMIIAHMGYPWVNETVVLLAKHPNVFAEISWVLSHPWQAYQALIAACDCGVTEKLLFGSGFPCAVAAQCIETLYSINHLCHGTDLPTIPREQLRGIVERDTLALLGISGQGFASSSDKVTQPQLAQAASAMPEDDHQEL